MKGTMVGMLKATSSPPTHAAERAGDARGAPCTMKISMMERGLAPSVRRIAMSACLSVTVITSVDTRLNAATATISVRMMNIIVFSICTASYQAALVRVQSCTRTWSPRPTARRLGGGARVVHVGQLQLHAGRAAGAVELGGVVERGQRQAAVVFVVADREHADDVERLQPRQRAGGRHLRARRDHGHLVADG
jgi:hypothetical protein